MSCAGKNAEIERDYHATQPLRVQLPSTPGWHEPEDTVVVAGPSKWGNPHAFVDLPGIPPDIARRLLVSRFESSLTQDPHLACPPYPPLPYGVDDVVRELRGKHLACWCPLDVPCHADVLLRYANRADS